MHFWTFGFQYPTQCGTDNDIVGFDFKEVDACSTRGTDINVKWSRTATTTGGTSSSTASAQECSIADKVVQIIRKY